MPSLDLFTYFQADLELKRTWFINGRHVSTRPEFFECHARSLLSCASSWHATLTLFMLQYGQTSEHWLQLQDANRTAAIAELERDAQAKGFDAVEGRKAYYRFRTFFLAVAVFFAMHNGEEWGVGHYLFTGRK